MTFVAHILKIRSILGQFLLYVYALGLLYVYALGLFD